MRAAIYIRVSTDHEEQKLSPDHQLMTCREYIEDIGLETDDRLIYNDAGLSGTEMENRTEVRRLVADARNGRFDAVVFTAISRFARDLSDALALKKRLETVYGIRIISVEEGYDTAVDGRNSEMIFTVHAMVAAHKSHEMSKAIRRGLRQSAATGRHIGNVPPFGYVKTAGKRLVPDERTAPIVQEIFRLYLAGVGSKAIAEELNRRGVPTASKSRGKGDTWWQASTIQRILRNPVYAGDLVANRWRNDVDIRLSRQLDSKVKRQMMRDRDEWVVVRNNHPALVDRAAFNLVQDTMDMKAKNKGLRRTSNVLSGLMKCGACGGAVVVSGRSGRNGQAYKYVGCAAVKRIGKHACANHSLVRYSDVLDAVLTPLRAFATNPDTADRLVDWILQSTVDHGITERLALLQRRLERNEQRQEKALAAYTEGGFPLDMIQKHRAELLEEKRRLQDEMERLEQRRLSKEALRSQRDRWMEMLNVFRHLDEYDPVTARAALSAVVECVVLTPDRRLHVLWKWCACDCTCVNAPQM
ncbi:recombinase family protein [Alicyclobacillus acidiphilus]|uniref:recombinase family protein n=1 Tax=Alicyclobacillus acidiphilus TaxID=182455 RepID=UPI00082B18F5|nr:recombinase family protein [Alicyclobacillus acidiphilus]